MPPWAPTEKLWPHQAEPTTLVAWPRPKAVSQPVALLFSPGHIHGGVFAQCAHSANYYGDYPGNNPENHPPCGIMHNQFKTQKFKHLMLAMGPRDLNSAPYSPVHCSSHSMTSFQSSELTELPVVENSQLFAQRTVRPPYCTSFDVAEHCCTDLSRHDSCHHHVHGIAC